jgi:nickel/cobalt exporter
MNREEFGTGRRLGSLVKPSSERRRVRELPLALALTVTAASTTSAHDIPNARVDRSIQVTLRPGDVKVDYSVSLAELTLVQDLRALIGTLPGADRHEWFDRYGQVSGPLNAKGLRIAVDGNPLALRTKGFELVVEDHPRYTFHFAASLPSDGRLTIRDTNYEAGEGSSRLGIQGFDGIKIVGDDLPGDVSLIPIQPIWKMTTAEERRTRQVDVRFDSKGPAGASTVPAAAQGLTSSQPLPSAQGLSRLLDRSGVSVFGLCLIAFSLGAAHAIQPGHGKTLVAAASIGGTGEWRRGIILALTITFAHIGGVMAVALGLWTTRSSRYPDINRVLAQGAGFLIAAIGLWRLGRHLGGHGEHADDQEIRQSDLGRRSLFGLGLAGGIVPCWDAVVLILLAEAVGRLTLGLILLAAFSLGMAAVLVTVGVTAAHFRRLIERRDGEQRWLQRLGIASALAITLIGIFLMIS